MNKVDCVGLIVAILLTTGCSRSQTQAGSHASEPSTARPAKVRIELSTSPDVEDIPRLMAIDAMRADGYTLETLEFADTSATVLALARGDLDFAVVSDVTGWAAIEKGAPIVGSARRFGEPDRSCCRQGRHQALCGLAGQTHRSTEPVKRESLHAEPLH